MFEWNTKTILRLFILTIFIMVTTYLLFWLATHGSLKIDFGDLDGKKNIIIKNESSEIKFSTEEKSFSVRLESGKYSILVLSEDKTLLENAKIGRFLTSTTLNPEMEYQTSREFFGDNPGSCAEFLNDRLISYPCNGSFSSMALHVPATEKIPSYKVSIGNNSLKDEESVGDQSFGIIEAVQNEGDFLYVLVYERKGEYLLHNLYKIQIINNSMDFVFVRSFEGLKNDLTYRFKKENGQFIVYTPDLTSVFVGANLFSLKQLFITEQIESLGISPKISYLGDESYLISTEKLDENFDNNSQGTSPTTVYIINNEDILSKKTFSFGLSKIDSCLEYICTLSNTKNLQVLDRDFSLVKEFYSIEDFTVVGNSVLFADKDYVYEGINKFEKTFVAINLGKYQYGGVVNASGRSLISIVSDNKKHTLITGEPSDEEYIDELIAPLFENSFVNTISIYKDRVFVSPELGERVVDPVNGTLDYSENVKNAASISINETLRQIGIIDRGYFVKVNNL